MVRIIYVLIVTMLLSITIYPFVSAQTQIGNEQDCPDYCDERTSILYLKGVWNPKLRICEYAYQEECKYGCALADSKLSKERNKPNCALFPDELPNNETESREIIFNVVKELYERDVKDASINIFGTEYQVGDNGTIFIQLLDADKQAINDGLCYVDIYNPDKSVYIDDGFMMYLNNSDGLYYYDLVIPNDEGVFMLSAKCSFYNNLTYYNVVQDTFANVALPTTNYGSETYIAIGYYGNYSSFVQLSDIPIENLESATLYLYAFYSAGNIGTVYRLTESWNESTLTWNNQPAYDPYVWENISANYTGWHAYNITELMKSWANGTYTNYGMLINCTQYSTNITAYYSKEQGNALKPGMIAVYHTTDQLTEIKGSGELHVTRHFSDLNQSIYDSISNLNDITAEDVWNYTTRTLTDYNFTEILDYLNQINSTVVSIENKVSQLDLDVQEIRDFQVNELSNNLTEIKITLDYINSTSNRTYTYIQGLINLSADDIWSYHTRTLTGFNFTVNINDTNIINTVNAHNSTVMNKLYSVQEELEAIGLTTLQINTTTALILAMLFNLTIGNVSVQADVNWSEGELVLYNITSPVQALAEVVRFQAEHIQVVTTTDTCLDSNTLNHHVNTTNCIADQCFENEFDTQETCHYGCKNNMCVPPPWIAILFAMVLASVISAGGWLIIRRREE